MSAGGELAALQIELAELRAARDEAYAFLEAGAATPEIAAAMRMQPLVVWLRVAASTIRALEEECTGLRAAVQSWKELQTATMNALGDVRRELDLARLALKSKEPQR